MVKSKFQKKKKKQRKKKEASKGYPQKRIKKMICVQEMLQEVLQQLKPQKIEEKMDPKGRTPPFRRLTCLTVAQHGCRVNYVGYVFGTPLRNGDLGVSGLFQHC